MPKDEYDINFDFDFTLSLTDYMLMSLYLVFILPLELVSRIANDCYTAFQERNAREEKMMPLFME